MAVNEPYIVPFYRDFYPTWADPKNPSSLQRSESWKDNPHYESDNARDIIYPDAFPRSTTNKILNGALKFDAENEVWEHKDEEIDFEVKKYLTSRYGMENYDILVTIDRTNHEVRYEAVIDDAKKIYSKDGKDIYWSELMIGAQFLIIKNQNDLNNLNDEIKKAGFDKQALMEDTWVKQDERSAYMLNNKNIKLSWNLDRRNPFIYVRTDLKHIKPKKESTTEGIAFNDLEEGKKFVFKDALPILRQYHIAWDEVLTKKDGKAVRKNGKVLDLKNQNLKVITEEEFNNEIKYKKDKFENFFDGLFSEYETKKSNIGEEIRIPIDNFWKEMEQDGVFKNKFISLSTGPKDAMHGHYNGHYNNFVWTIDKNFADFTKMEH
jgi:hypothetical protein